MYHLKRKIVSSSHLDSPAMASTALPEEEKSTSKVPNRFHVSLPSGHSETVSVLATSTSPAMASNPVRADGCLSSIFSYCFSYIDLSNRVMKRAESCQKADSSIELEVFLPSGRCETVAVSQSGTVADLKIAAQQSFGHRFLRLATGEGRLLDPRESLQISGLQDGDSIAAVAQQPKIAATGRAFALWCGGGHRIVTWGHPDYGGDSSRVQDQLRNVQQVRATRSAFAAILADGSVVTWGDPDFGGDSSRVQHQLTNVQQICGTQHAFAAILADGSVVTWGHPEHGGDSSTVRHQLRNVQQISSTVAAFAAVLADGTVVTWGSPVNGGDSSRVQYQLMNVQQICGTLVAFAAILADGSVVTWGRPGWGGNSSRVQFQLRNVQQICGTLGAFAAVLADGNVVTWGNPDYGGDSSAVQDQLRNVQQICGTHRAFASILADGTVVT